MTTFDGSTVKLRPQYYQTLECHQLSGIHIVTESISISGVSKSTMK